MKQLIKQESAFDNGNSFDHAQRVALMLSKSDMVPAQFKGNVPNTIIALELSNRIGANPLMVMQNLYIVHGKPSWSSTFIIASINASKKFSPLRFEVSGEGDERGCIAWALELATNERVEGPKVTLKMAKDEGWFNKAGSKWKTMPDLMIRYRAAAFFGRLYAPELMMGMLSVDEVQDIADSAVTIENVSVQTANDRIMNYIQNAETVEQLLEIEDESIELTGEQMELFNEKKKELAQ